MRLYLSKKAYAELLEGNNNLPDFELKKLDDPESELKCFFKFYGEFIIKEAPNQDLTDFYAKKAAKQGIIVVKRFALKQELTLEPIKRRELMMFSEANRRLNFIKIIIKPVKKSQVKQADLANN